MAIEDMTLEITQLQQGYTVMVNLYDNKQTTMHIAGHTVHAHVMSMILVTYNLDI